MRRSMVAAGMSALFLFCLAPTDAKAQFGFSIGGGSGGHGSNRGGISFGFGSGGRSGYGQSEYGHSEGRGPRIGIGFSIPTTPNYIRPRQPQNTWVPQQPRTVSPPVVRRPEPKPEPPPKPVANNKPAATTPEQNTIDLVARQITLEEIRAAQVFFNKRLEDYLSTLQQRLPAVDVDTDALTSLLLEKGIAAEIQIRILDALQAGDLDAAETIWIGIFPDSRVPFGMPRARTRFAEFYVTYEGGSCTMADVVQLENDLIEMGVAEEPCCGAESLLDDVKESLRISQVIAQSKPGNGDVNVGVPAGEVGIVYLPSLPDGTVVVLDEGTVMLGTGGVGKLHMARGNVASAMGYPQPIGQAVEENNAKLVRDGILLENPTEDVVNYVVDRGSFTMQPGYRQSLTGEASRIISFDKGTGGQTAKYKLAEGSYKFVIKNRAWDLQKTVYKVNIDNSDNLEPFHCIVQGEHVVIPAGQTQTHSSDYPIVVRFDRGNGSSTKQVVHKRSSGDLFVAVNPADSKWDLFDPSAVITAESNRPSSTFTPAF